MKAKHTSKKGRIVAVGSDAWLGSEKTTAAILGAIKKDKAVQRAILNLVIGATLRGGFFRSTLGGTSAPLSSRMPPARKANNPSLV